MLDLLHRNERHGSRIRRRFNVRQFCFGDDLLRHLYESAAAHNNALRLPGNDRALKSVELKAAGLPVILDLRAQLRPLSRNFPGIGAERKEPLGREGIGHCRFKAGFEALRVVANDERAFAENEFFEIVGEGGCCRARGRIARVCGRG